MPVVSVSMPDPLLENLDTFIAEHGYSGRSEAVRDAARELLYEFDASDADGPVGCVVTVTFDHDTDAETELSSLRHTHDELVTTNVHSHVGGTCLEVFVVEGPIGSINSYVTRLRTVDGVTAVEYSVVSPGQRALA